MVKIEGYQEGDIFSYSRWGYALLYILLKAESVKEWVGGDGSYISHENGFVVVRYVKMTHSPMGCVYSTELASLIARTKVTALTEEEIDHHMMLYPEQHDPRKLREWINNG